MGRNWAGNITFSSDRVAVLATVEELQELVVSEPKLKAQGTRHSFSSVADSDGVLVSLEKFKATDMVGDGLVRVGAGVTYGQLAPFLDERGFALHNLASLPHISVAGACATATHGSGVGNPNLALAVAEMAIVDGQGRLRIINRVDDEATFRNCVVHLGGLGVVVALTLMAQPTYQVAQTVYENLPLATLEKHFDAVRSAGYSVSLFTKWSSSTFEQVWVKRRCDREEPAPAEMFGAKAATRKLHPLAELDPVNCTEQLGVPGPWHERLPHFRMDFTPSSGEELQSEFFVPDHMAVDALKAIDQIGHLVSPLLHVSEIRSVAADDLLLSPARGRDVVGIHFTWKKDWERVRAVLPVVEQALAPFGGTPHWGKLSTMPPEDYHARYPQLAAFAGLAETWDPERKFRNAFLDMLLDRA